MKKSIKIWLLLAFSFALCLSIALTVSAGEEVCHPNNHTYENECDKVCNICQNNRIAPHSDGDTNGTCDLCQIKLCDHLDTPLLIDSAECEKPRTCRICGETEGYALGHYWAKATCTAPSVCSTCGKRDNEPLGHKWGPSSCTTSASCSVCSAVKAPEGHMYDSPCDSDCNSCAEPRAVKHADTDANNVCDLCGINIPSDGLNGGEIAVIICLPILAIGIGVLVYVVLTKAKKAKMPSPANPEENNDKPKPEENNDEPKPEENEASKPQ